jgi:WD40 repeat protein
MQPNQNFEVLGQLQVATSAITNMVVSLDSEYLFVVSQDRPNEIQQFEISHDGPSSKDPIAVLEETHSLVGLKVVEDKESNNYLLSTSRKGQVSLWKIGKSTTTTMTQITIPIEDDDIVLSTDVDSDYLFIGSEQGMVWVYSLEHLLSEPKEDECVPLKSFKAFPNGGVSAICAAGPGTMGRGDTTTTALVTGSTSGGIKQWELIPRGKHALEYWPKLVSQTMPGKAHLLGRGGDDGEPILDLKVIDDVVLSVAPSRSTIWNTATGKSYFDMEGLEFEATRPSCIVLSSHLLVTNGMEQYVCVHDFSVAELENIEDMIERDNDDDDYGDNNTDDDW